MPTPQVSIFKGLIFPDRSVRKHVNDIIKEIQTDQSLLEQLLQGEETSRRDSIVNAIMQRGVKVVLGFPRTNFEVPIVTVTLSSGDEDTVIGDELDIRIVDFTDEAILDTAISAGERMPKVITLTNVSNTFPAVGMVRINDELFSYDTGTATTLRLVGRSILNTAPEAHDVGDQVVRNVVEKVTGSYERMSLRVDVLDDNGDMTAFLGQVIKAGLRGNMRRLGQDGLIEVTMSSTDFAQMPDHIPNHIYSRTVVINFRYELALPSVLDSITEVIPTNESPPIFETQL